MPTRVFRSRGLQWIAPALAVVAGAGIVGDPPLDAQEAGLVNRALFATPPMDARPCVRWWWPGAHVEAAELARELRVIREAGFGCVEIQSFAAGLPGTASSQVFAYGSPVWYDRVAGALDRARELGLTVDLTLGSSWPSAGAYVTDALSLKQLTVTGALVHGPGILDVPFPDAEQPLGYLLAESLLELPNTFDASKMQPVALMAVRVSDDQTGAPAPVSATIPGLPPLPASVLLDGGSVQDLGSSLSAGRLRWSIPEGMWAVLAFHQGPTGSKPFYSAEPGALVIDHLSESATKAHLQVHAETAASRFGAHVGTTLRSFFVDSLELRSELHWTDDLLSEFAVRRGYRLEPFLPFLFRPFAADAYLQKIYPRAPARFDAREIGERVRYDYDRTISDLLVERFFRPIGTWGATRGVHARVQAHGAPVDLLSAYGTATIPETEGLYAGGNPSFLRMAASAARLAGQPLVSSEILALVNDDATPAQILHESFRHFAAGVNHVVLHGFPYLYLDGFAYPGWMPFNSPYMPGRTYIPAFGTHLNETYPYWRFMPAVNTTLARAQLFLRAGTPVADIALYIGDAMYADEPQRDVPITRELDRSGHNYDYVNGDLLVDAFVDAGQLRVGHAAYKALVVADVAALPSRVAQKIASLALSGFPVVVSSRIPERSTGLLSWEHNDLLVRASFEQMFGMTREQLMDAGRVRVGSAAFASDVTEVGAVLVSELQVEPDVIFGEGREFIRYVHRRAGQADYFFVVGASSRPLDVLMSFPNPGLRRPEIFDPVTGRVRHAPAYSHQGSRTVLPVRLEPNKPFAIGFETPDTGFHLEATDIPQLTRASDGSIVADAYTTGTYSITIDGETRHVTLSAPSVDPIPLPFWDIVAFYRDALGNVTRHGFTTRLLADLATLTGVETFAGSATYAVLFELGPEYLQAGTRLTLDLGDVRDAAIVRANGAYVTSVLGAPFEVDLTGRLVEGVNRVEVEVVPSQQKGPAGLLGPVVLRPRYRTTITAASGVMPAPLPFSVVVTPPNFPDSTNEEMIAAISQAAQLANHVNFQWFWKTPPGSVFTDGGAAVECEQVAPWVAEARRLGLGVTLQFQAFVTELTPGTNIPRVRVTTPVAPYTTASFGDEVVQDAYLEQITCLSELKPDYLVLGPEVNFVVNFAREEFEHFRPVYRDAYTRVKTLSPKTQVGLSWQYDGLRNPWPADRWQYIDLAGPQDFIGLTTYFGYSDDRFLQYPVAASIPADYYQPIRERFPTKPIIFTEVGYSSFYPLGEESQVNFLRRLSALLGPVRPAGVTWALLHDVDFFVGAGASLNDSGLLSRTGEPKPAWNEALRLKAAGVFAPTAVQMFGPQPLPFSITATPAMFPLVVSPELNMQALTTAAEAAEHVSLQFAWRDRVTEEVWGCERIRPYVAAARNMNRSVTLQFNVFAAIAPAEPGGPAQVELLNPLLPATPGTDNPQPSFSIPAIREAYLAEVQCLGTLEPDYLVLGPEVNFLLGSESPDEFYAFAAVYQHAYSLVKEVSPSTRVGTSFQYDVIRNNRLAGEAEAYVNDIEPRDFVGLTSYFGGSDANQAEFPEATSIPDDYYQEARTLLGADVPIVFTEIAWSTYYPRGRENQVLFLNRLPFLLQDIAPENVIWGLLHDVVDYFPGENGPINHVGLRQVDGPPKPAWAQILWLRNSGLYRHGPRVVP